ncbi:MAG: hypothetical protein ACRD68_07495 [Pyrinomonadaceae bacterium]
MKLISCRDCGTMVPSDARGCPKCARNMEAERMIGRFVLGVLVSAAVSFVFLVLGFWVYRD